MNNLSKRSTVYFDPAIYQAISDKAASLNMSISEIVDEAVRVQLIEGNEDLAAFDVRANEHEISYEALLKKLREDNKSS